MSTFHALVVLMIVLTFSTSFATLAQQNPVLTEVSKTAAAQKANAAAEAKAAAERDASKDTNEPLWLCIGAGGFPLIFSSCFLGSVILNPSEYHYTDDIWVYACVVLPLSAFYIGGVSWGIFAERPPPPERLIGKSPEYVASYLHAYKRKMRTLRGLSTVAGGGAVCLSLFGFGLAQNF